VEKGDEARVVQLQPREPESVIDKSLGTSSAVEKGDEARVVQLQPREP
jgi:hypothetical protein